MSALPAPAKAGVPALRGPLRGRGAGRARGQAPEPGLGAARSGGRSGSGTYVSATNPAALTESTLNGATVTVSLVGLIYASGVSASSFALVTSPAIAGLSISNVTGGASGSTSATLTLATGAGFDFDTPATLAGRVLAAVHSESTNVTTGVVPLAPTDEAPSFGSGSVSAKTFHTNTPIAGLQVPAASGGNGALTCSVSGLPAGLVFDPDGMGSRPGTQPREFCGTPTTATSGQTVTVTAQDADANRAAADRDTLTLQVSALARPTLAGWPGVVPCAAARSMIQRKPEPAPETPRREPA